MKSDRRTPVAIVGGGFSGTMLAAQLARCGVSSVLIEGNGREGRGVAYSTSEPAHVLNVRAEGMSAWPDDPEHFARAYADQGGDPRGFAERRFFGDYLGGILEETRDAGRIEVVDDQSISACRLDDHWLVTLGDGSRIAGDVLALATGNHPPEPFTAAARAGERYIGNPWSDVARGSVAAVAESGGAVMIVGTGLTMVDTVLSLDAAGHCGRIVALSRRGLVPRGHADFVPAHAECADVPKGSVVALWRWLRGRAGQTSWRAAVDSLRPHSHRLWQSLSEAEQRRFLRHARPWWDVHRHRIAPHVAQKLKDMIAGGRLEIVAGRVRDMSGEGGAVTVALVRRGGDAERVERFEYVFNCTGPLGAIGRTTDPLLRQLLDDAVVKADHLGIGLAVDERCRAGERLWALGPLTKGRYWEIVAVPDIRGQAAAVAQDIAMELRG